MDQYYIKSESPSSPHNHEESFFVDRIFCNWMLIETWAHRMFLRDPPLWKGRWGAGLRKETAMQTLNTAGNSMQNSGAYLTHPSMFCVVSKGLSWYHLLHQLRDMSYPKKSEPFGHAVPADEVDPETPDS